MWWSVNGDFDGDDVMDRHGVDDDGELPVVNIFVMQKIMIL